MSLKHLFTATYEDGSTLDQNAEDISIFEPEKRSSFFDALKIGSEKRMVRFELKGADHRYAVDLKDGHFEIDGVPFYMHEEPIKDLEIIFFRQHTHTYRLADSQETGHEIVYRMGWKTRGKNYQRVMQID